MIQYPSEIITTQVFSRSGLGFLWSKRAELDPGQLSIINSLYINKKKSTLECQQQIKYKLASSKPGQLGYGRYYGSKGSLETLEKECRGTICKEFYHDIDVVNCHPVLLEQFAKNKYDKELPELGKLCMNREEYFKATGMPREEAKTEIIRILYGGKNTIDYFIPLSLEVRKFSKFLSGLEEYTELWKYCSKQDNTYGTLLSFILQTEERKCMIVMKETFEKAGWSVDVLAYDGVMIRKREGSNLKDDIVSVETAIMRDVCYELKLVSKEFSSYDIPVHSEEITSGVSLEAYTDMKTQFELNNFYYIPGNTMMQINGANILQMSLDHAREYYSKDWRFSGSSKFGDFTPFFDLWRKDGTRRMINSIDMKDSEDPTVYVMPPKFAWKNIEGGCEADVVTMFLELIRLFGGKSQSDYIIHWLAHLIQKPFELPGVALIISGDKGCGKDTAFDFIMEYIIGLPYSINYGDNNQFFGTHDIGRINKFLIKLEEADRLTCLRNASKLKAMITSGTETFNPKCEKPYTMANYMRLVMTTNGACPVEMTGSERRYVIAACKPTKKGDYAYWTHLRKVLFTPEAGKKVGDFLAGLDLADFDPRVLPVDDYQSAIIAEQMTAEEKFVDQWDGEKIGMGEFFQLYRSYCIDNDLPYCNNVLTLGRRLLTLIRDGKLIKHRMTAGFLLGKPGM